MKRYIRTKDGKLFDLEEIKKNLKKNSAYPHLHDWELEPTDDGRGSLRLSWIADFKGSKSKPEKIKSPKECAAILDCDSSEYDQADTVDELVDAYVLYDPYPDQHEYLIKVLRINGKVYYEYLTGINRNRFDWQSSRERIFGSIWVDGSLVKVAEMNEEGELKLL